jgi:4-hydroxy-tetrahydrodipicolinate reductase
MLKVAIIGATGRMGREIINGLAASPGLVLSGAVTMPGDRLLGADAAEQAGLDPAGVIVTDDRSGGLLGAHVAIDFTLPAALDANLRAAIDSGTPMVVGTTGLNPQQHDALAAAAQQIPLVYAANMSIGMNVFMALVRRAASALNDSYDAEIIEAHHRHKVDAPSGTALALGELVAGARNRRLKDVAVHARHGQTGPRVPGTIGFSVVRAGSIVGDHRVLFANTQEQLELVHRASDRAAFAHGAIQAASWVAGRAPGLYSMAEVLGLEDH